MDKDHVCKDNKIFKIIIGRVLINSILDNTNTIWVNQMVKIDIQSSKNMIQIRIITDNFA